MKGFLKRRRFGLTATLLLTAFTVYALLDTFVIPHEYAAAETVSTASAANENSQTEASGDGTAADSVTRKEASAGRRTKKSRSDSSAKTETAAQTPEGTGSAAAEGTVLTEDSYSDGNVTIALTETRLYDTVIYTADVQLADPSLLKTALAQNTYGRNIKDETSAIAADAGAILAVNGDFYGARTGGYVIRNGVLYRDQGNGSEDLVIRADGSFSVIREDEVSAQELLDSGAVQVLSFGPALVEDGQIAITEGEEVGKAMASNPRTAVGIIDEGHYVFVVSDGRTDESEGLSLYQLAQYMQSLGVSTAYNLDGGGSSTMVFNGKVVNNPTTSGNSTKERSVSDIVYIGY